MKNSIKFIKRPKLKNVYFIAAWPGMGEVAFRAANYLKEKLKFEQFAYLNTPEFFPLQGIDASNGEIFIPSYNGGSYYFYRNKESGQDIVLFIDERQPAQDLGYEYAQKVLEINTFVKIKRMLTFAALPAPIEHTQKPAVLLAVTKKELMNEFKSIGLKPLSMGEINGLNGLLLGVAKLAHIEGVCLLSEVPLYTMHIENPQGALAVLGIIEIILKLKIDFTDLINAVKLQEEEIGRLVDYLKISTINNEPIDEGEIDKIKSGLAAYTKLPDSAKQNIEVLFREAGEDIAKANLLKQELDKWSVYKEYEDRFLDLFRKPDNEAGY